MLKGDLSGAGRVDADTLLRRLEVQVPQIERVRPCHEAETERGVPLDDELYRTGPGEGGERRQLRRDEARATGAENVPGRAGTRRPRVARARPRERLGFRASGPAGAPVATTAPVSTVTAGGGGKPPPTMQRYPQRCRPPARVAPVETACWSRREPRSSGRSPTEIGARWSIPLSGIATRRSFLVRFVHVRDRVEARPSPRMAA